MDKSIHVFFSIKKIGVEIVLARNTRQIEKDVQKIKRRGVHHLVGM